MWRTGTLYGGDGGPPDELGLLKLAPVEDGVVWLKELISPSTNYQLGHCEAVPIHCSRKLEGVHMWQQVGG